MIEEDAKDIEEEEPESPLEAETKYPITAEIFVPPDGDYGWLIALGAFNALFWTAGLVKSYGVIFDMILKTFPGNLINVVTILLINEDEWKANQLIIDSSYI